MAVKLITLDIPDRWLQGCITGIRARDAKISWRTALVEAVSIWHDQEAHAEARRERLDNAHTRGADSNEP